MHITHLASNARLQKLVIRRISGDRQDPDASNPSSNWLQNADVNVYGGKVLQHAKEGHDASAERCQVLWVV